MIDASSFASRHNAFWASYTPTSEHYVRRVNLEYADRWCPPLARTSVSVRAAFVAELAFARFCARTAGLIEEDLDRSALEEAKKRLEPLLDDPLILSENLTSTERSQTTYLENSLISFFSYRNPPIILRPVFIGCGYIDASEGDVISNNCLYEIKSVDRQFRSVDIRQLITYCALNYLSSQHNIEYIGIFNPKRGLFFESPVEYVSHEISGQSSQNLFDAIIRAISSGDISR